MFDEPQSGDVDIQNSDINGKGCLFINSGVTNQGIKGYTDRLARIFPANSITIDFFGNAYYRSEPYKLATHNHVFSFSGGVLSDEAVGLYLVASMAYLPKIYSYGNMATKTTLKENQIILPAITVGKPDFEFMRRYIATLKAERVATLKAYLQAAGLSDTILTEGELAALDALRQNRVELEPFKLKDIFTLEKGKRLTKADMLPGELNYIGAISINNGIRQKIHNGRIWQPNCITVNYNGSVGYSYYQEEPFHASDDVNVLYMKSGILNRNIALYFCANLFKVSRSFSYSDKWTLDKMRETTLHLPIISHEEIHWGFIKDLISAQIKLCIKNVLSSKDFEITTTEKVVESDLSYFENSSPISMAAEPFEIYQWPEVSNENKNRTDTILVGCWRDKKHLEWILANNLYNIRLGKRKGSAEDKPECFGLASRLYLYDAKHPENVSVFRIVDHQEKLGTELKEMGYPRKSPGKSYMTFKIEAQADNNKEIDVDVAEILGNLSNHVNGAPVFIEPTESKKII